MWTAETVMARDQMQGQIVCLTFYIGRFGREHERE